MLEVRVREKVLIWVYRSNKVIFPNSVALQYFIAGLFSKTTDYFVKLFAILNVEVILLKKESSVITCLLQSSVVLLSNQYILSS